MVEIALIKGQSICNIMGEEMGNIADYLLVPIKNTEFNSEVKKYLYSCDAQMQGILPKIALR